MHLQSMERLASGKELRFQRMFQVWAYTTSHDQLLLRSTRDRTLPTRLDILFKQVGWMVLPPSFPSLTVREADETILHSMSPAPDTDLLRNRRLYLLDGGERRGIVAAREVEWHEDQCAFDEPSPLLNFFPALGIGTLTAEEAEARLRLAPEEESRIRALFRHPSESVRRATEMFLKACKKS